ncbi:MAG TPA: mechanosensitive ion channel family protein [Candidatus Brocadiia bacterium]|nr:mechanosensitive ion channel family protein [Candidatus Brocadiia bacterium]
MLAAMEMDWRALSQDRVVVGVVKTLIMLAIGVPAIRMASYLIAKNGGKRFSPQSAMLLRKTVTYGGAIMLFMLILDQLGFELTALLGAAGVVGLALGFASQTSVSNIISGIFLISEKPFSVGDVIQVGDKTGVVLSVDLLSVKMRTFDNKYVRVPNESLIKMDVVNITRFPIRRMDIIVGVAYKEDVKRVKAILLDIALKNQYCLDDPAPLIILNNFGDSALEFKYGLWVAKEDYLNLLSTITDEIKERFDAEGIEIPFPHLSLYSGSVTDPFPIRIVGGADPGAPPRGM